MLRSINVGGRNRVAMADLRRPGVARSGYRESATYVQSGNVVFSWRRGRRRWPAAIEDRMAAELGLAVPVMVRNQVPTRRQVCPGNPFTPPRARSKPMHVTFLAEGPDAGKVGQSCEAEDGQFGDDRCQVVGRDGLSVLPGWLREDQTEQRLPRAAAGRATATTRNWRTLLTLADMCGLPAHGS